MPYSPVDKVKANRSVKPNPKLIYSSHGIKEEGQVVNDTAYDILQPKILISSRKNDDNKLKEVSETTSGVHVRDEASRKFMTVANHGIGVDTKVFQPSELFLVSKSLRLGILILYIILADGEPSSPFVTVRTTLRSVGYPL